MENYLASNIFTPTTQAIHTYIERELLNERLVDALRTPGTQLIVYGLTGSGKSTLLYNKLNQTYEGAISIQCTRETTYEQLLLNAFDQLGPFFTAEKNRSIKEEFGIDFKTIKSNLSQSDNIKMSRILPAQLTPERLIRLFGMSKCCWVIEDFHKLQDLQKQRIAQLMKVFMDHAKDFPEVKIVLVGTVTSSKEVVKLAHDMRNRTAEVYVPLMSEKELFQIILKGESLLNIIISADVKETIARFSSGMPSVTHQLCLNICNSLGIYQTSDLNKEISYDDFSNALRKYVNEISENLKDYFDEIITINKIEVPNFLKSLINIRNTSFDVNQINKSLKELDIQLNDNVIKNYLDLFSKEDSAVTFLVFDRNNSHYRFRDPFFKAYCCTTLEVSNFKENQQAHLDFKRYQDKEKELVRQILDTGNFEF